MEPAAVALASSTAKVRMQLPPCSVLITLMINSETQVIIQQGRRVGGCAGIDADSGTDTCTLQFARGTVEDSWGRHCRKVTWCRQVPHGSYIRLQFCKADAVYDMDSGPVSHGALAANALLKFQVNGRDFVHGIAGVASEEGGLLASSCLIKAACIGEPSLLAPDHVDAACCQWYVTTTPTTHTVVSWGDGTTLNLPNDTEIVVGPIGDNLQF